MNYNLSMKKKKLFITIGAVITGLVLAATFPLIVLGARTSGLNTKYEYLKTDAKYSNKVEIEGIELVKQDISCGYATIEMLSTFYGNTVTEENLDQKNNGAVSTSSSTGFYKEIKQSIPTKSFVKHSYLSNDKLLKEIHDSLSNNNPVALEWAAKLDNVWTLHFSLISALDIANDNITIYNPYGYIENINLKEFISRSTFNAYKNMPIFYHYAFAFGMFEKNTIIYAE